jgi:hypothetical protein
MFRKVLLALGLLLLACSSSFAQNSTTVSGTIQDLGGQAWLNGTFNFVFVPSAVNPVGPYTWPGGAIPANIGGSLSGTGTYSVSIPSNSAISPIQTTWTATFCPQASSGCFTISKVTITGATQTLNATPPTILINLQSAQPPVLAYSTTEVTGAAIGSQFYLLGTGLQICSAVSGNSCTTWSSGSATNAANLVGPGSISGSFSGNYTTTGVETNTGGFNPKFLGAEEYASAFTGADCGLKIAAAITALPANGGVVNVNQACGPGSSGSPWSAVTISIPNVIIRFVEPGVYWIGGITLSGVASGITTTMPCSTSTFGQQCPVLLQEGSGLNLPSLITENANYTFVYGLALDGFKSSNPTGGVVLKVNNANRVTNDFFATQNGATHGIWVFSTAGTNTSNSGTFTHFISVNNNNDAVLLQNTSDTMFTDNAYSLVLGITGTVNTQNAATGGCAANCVTWVSGSKWSTDSSLAGTYIRINGVLYRVLSIQSQTVLTLDTNAVISGVAAAPGTQTGVTFNWGNAVENKDSGAMRYSAGELSGGPSNVGMDGLLAYCTTAVGSGAVIVTGNGLGNNIQHDIEILGFDPVGAANCATGFVIAGNKFSGGAVRTPTNTYDNVKALDGGNHVIVANYYTSAGGSNTAKYGVELNETTSGRAVISQIGGVCNTSYGTGCFLDNNFNRSSINMTDPAVTTTTLQGQKLNICSGPACANITFPGGTAPSLVLPANSGTLANNPPGTTGLDLGSTSLPWANLWLGTAATNNFKFQPAATSAARIIQIADPSATSGLLLGGTNLTFSPIAPTIAAGGCGGSAAAISAPNGTASFNIFTGTAPTSGGCTITMPAATTDWHCEANHVSAISTTNFIIQQTGALSTTSVNLQLFSDVAAATAPTASDTWRVSCTAN